MKTKGFSSMLSPWRHRRGILVFCMFSMAAGLFCAGLGMLAWDTSNRIFRSFLGPEDSRDDYLVMGKLADPLSLLDETRSGFKKSELDEIQSRAFVKKVLPVKYTQVPVSLSMVIGNRRIGTEIFFEAVEDEVLGKLPPGWHWSESDNQAVPLLLPRSFLALFNMGFAASRGLPAIHEDMIGRLVFTIAADTPSGRMEFPARLAGLTDRFSSFIVPGSFLDHINPPGDQEPRRLIVKVRDNKDPRIETWIKEHNYEVHEGSATLRQAGLVASGLSGSFLILGLVLWLSSVLGFFQYLGSWSALFAQVLETLVMLGHPMKRLMRTYSVHIAVIQLVSMAPAVLGLVWIGAQMGPLLEPWFPPGTPSGTFVPFLAFPMVFLVQQLASLAFFRKTTDNLRSSMKSIQEAF